MQKNKTKALVIASLLAALSLILTRFMGIVILGGSIRLSFGELPIILSGIYFGPVIGALTGFVSDIVGATLFPQGAFFPGFTLSAMLVGIIPGIIFLGKKKSFPLWKIVLSSVIIGVFVSMGLGTYWLSILLKKGFWILLPSRIISKLILMPIEIGIIYMLTRKIKIV